jgi:hypothetical protein
VAARKRALYADAQSRAGFGGTYGHVFTLGDLPLSGPANTGSA